MTNEEAKDYIRIWCPYDRQDEIIRALSNSGEDCISRIEQQIHEFAEQMYKAGYEDGEKDTLKRSICKVIEAEKAYRDGFAKGYKAKKEENEET